MDKIRFLLDDSVAYATVLKVSDNVINITFSKQIPEESTLLNGFEIINENNGKSMTGDFYHLYNTVYHKIDDNTVMLSNDGSVYTEENDVDNSGSKFEPTEPYVPTLEEVKTRKISELSSACQDIIIAGVDVDIDGVIEHFSYNDEDQINIKELFDLTYYTNCSVHYHADGGNCKSYTSDQFISIYVAQVSNKMHHRTYFNQLKMYLDSLDDIESIKNIEYGVELSGEYLNTYNNIMEQERRNLESFLAKRSAIHVLMGGT